MKWVVLGLGKSGQDAVNYLTSLNRQVMGLDRSIEKYIRVDKLYCKNSDRAAVDYSDVGNLVVSPGIELSHPQVTAAKRAGVEIIGEAELGFRFLQNRIIAVTGTNGKTTTTMLIAHVLQSAGYSVKTLGNIGTSITSYLLDPNPREILVIELSSFQIETLKSKKIEVGVILNITPDHLDRYSSMEQYADAKLQMQNCLLPEADFWISSQIKNGYMHKITTAARVFDDKNHEVDTLKQVTTIFEQNLLAAFHACSRFFVSTESFLQAVKNFATPEHRLELVAIHNGIHFYNDSKATNVEAALSAVMNIHRSIILIAGGVDKKGSYAAWKQCFANKVKKVFVTGPASDVIAESIDGCCEIEKVNTFEDAVIKACHCAKEHDTVLLSPGCSSFDAFLNYKERGLCFKRLVRKFIGGSST